MKISMWKLFVCALLVSALGAPAAFACVSVTTETVAETQTNYNGSDCWWGGPSDNRMVTYLVKETVTNINLYQVTQNFCTGTTTRQFLSTVYSYTSGTCWQRTTWSCVGSKDWMPSPVCS